MSFAADSGDGWGHSPAVYTWNETQTSNWAQKDSFHNFGSDDAGSRGFDKENNDNFASDEPKSGGCFNCGEDGHNKADCPHPRKFTRACRTCNEEGHMSKDCPSRGPMTCRSCNEQGHRAKDCPSRGPMVCRACKEEGHMSRDCPTRGPLVCSNCNQEGHRRAKCENARVIDRSHVPDVDPDDAWNGLKEAIKTHDIDDVKDAIEKYSKASPEMTYVQLQEGIFDSGLHLFLIAKERALLPTYTNMDLQGNLNKKYSISYRFSDQPQRPREAEGWPMTREEILSRLDDAGIVVEQSVPYCSNCNEMGHTRKHCKEERTEGVDRPTIMCYNCNETGHRVRDCPQPRSTKGACRNCSKPGHKASECKEPRSAANIDCRKCGEMGHFSRDCPQGGGGGGGDKGTCHNCGSGDHLARECPKKSKSNDFYLKRSKTENAGINQDEDQFGSAVGGTPASDGGWNQGGSTGDGGWNASGSAGGGW